ncbi:hypothetical protein I4U23_001409 [Adineta vaga]|nr:hypothetical protein I4U23_001409 [Adineta vaga]
MTLTSIGQEITIYGGWFLIITGVIGGLLNVIVFLSLKTFRESTSAFYLIIISFINIGQLLFGLFSRVMIYGFAIDWNSESLFFCKFRLTIFTLCALISYTCLCLAIIDQYLATSFRPHWQQLSNIKSAHYLIFIFTFIWIIHVIPYPIFFEHVISSTTGKIMCIITNQTVTLYRNYYVIFLLISYIPCTITIIFGILAYHNIRRIAYRTVPFVRRELDKQLTIMVFAQVIANLVTNLPNVTAIAVTYATANVKDTLFLERIQFTSTVTNVMFYIYFASSFYIYICVSKRFRRQFIYVIYRVCLKRSPQQLVPINQIVPT